MAIQTANIGTLVAGTVFLWYRYEDQNSTNTNRWRATEVGGQNNSPYEVAVYVEDPTVAPPNNRILQLLAPGQTQWWPVPSQYATRNPEEYNWGGWVTSY